MNTEILEEQGADTISVKADFKIDKYGNKIYNLDLIIENFIEETQNLFWKNIVTGTLRFQKYF